MNVKATTHTLGRRHRHISVSLSCRFLMALIACMCLQSMPALSAETPATPPDASTMSVKTNTAMEAGILAFRQGAFGDASANFESAIRLYEQEASGAKRCEALIMLAEASYFTGQHRKALESLEKALVLARELRDSRQTATALGAIGNVHLAMGNSELAARNLYEGLGLARESGNPGVAAAINNNLGNLLMSQKQFGEALAKYRESAALADKAGDTSLAAQALVNAATAAFRGGAYADARSLLDQAMNRLQHVEDSYAKAYSYINAGLAYADLRVKLQEHNQALATQTYSSFNEGLTVARRLNDQRTVSYAYGHLGRLYEDERHLEEALELTRRAIFAAQQKNASETLYKWHWQSGRILAKQGKLDEAIVAYRHSIRTLQSVREEMSSCYANPESSYQKTAGVICLELVDLLLQRASRLQQGEAVEPLLVEARDTLEALKVFELREYFKDDCIDAARVVEKKLDTVSAKAAVIYPILLPDRVELLVSYAGRLKRFTLPVDSETLTREVRELRTKLVKRTTWEFLPHAQKLYDWIIRPLESDLDAMKPDTLVFVPDGPLRTIPMAALHDGHQFLISRYPIAITPSLNLTDPKPVRQEKARMLSLGLTQAVQGFPGLPFVDDELKSIRQLYGGELLLNSSFRLASLEEVLKREPFSIVHIASHGQFGGDIKDTFLLAFDEKFTMDRFGEYVGLFRFREEPLDLLTLSACETAAGDDRAALGLAGVAVRAGARSALATLWHVNDPASFELITEFYRQLRTNSVSRATALQAAQLRLINDLRYDHPGYWAPFLLINNWL